MKFFIRKYRKYVLKKQEKYLESYSIHIQALLSQRADNIPVFIVSYNNATYVENMVKQLNKKGIKPIILDNASSTGKERLSILQQNNCADVVFFRFNYGHMIGFKNAIYRYLPEVFAYTDPDLQFSDDLPDDFLEQLAELTSIFQVYKAGCALPTALPQVKADNTPVIISDVKEPFYVPQRSFSLEQWEAPYWRFLLPPRNLI